jgi:hypothetical protein
MMRKKFEDWQFDKLIRQKLQLHEPDFQESSWEKLEIKLDEQTPNHRFLNISILRWASILLCVAMLRGDLWISNTNTYQTQNSSNNTPSIAYLPKIYIYSEKARRKEQLSNIKKSEKKSIIKPKIYQLPQTSNPDNISTQNQNLNSDYNTQKINRGISVPFKSSHSEITSNIDTDTDNQPNYTDILESEKSTREDIHFIPQPAIASVKSVYPQNIDLEGVSLGNYFSDIVHTEEQNLPKWRVGMASAVESNLRSYSTQASSSVPIALVAQRTLSPQLSLTGGIGYSRRTQVFEEADNIEYLSKLKKNFSPIVKIQSDWLEIPLNIRYQTRQNIKGTWFVGVGITSYLQWNQSFQSIEPKTGPIGIRFVPVAFENASVNRLHTDFAAALNLEMGWETTLNSRWSLQISPYLRIPMKKVGIEQQAMQSLGLQVGLWLR